MEEYKKVNGTDCIKLEVLQEDEDKTVECNVIGQEVDMVEAQDLDME